MAAQKPTQKGRRFRDRPLCAQEACPEWAHRGLPLMGAQKQKPAHNGRTEACLERARGRPVPNGRAKACPDWEDKGLPIIGAPRPA